MFNLLRSLLFDRRRSTEKTLIPAFERRTGLFNIRINAREAEKEVTAAMEDLTMTIKRINKKQREKTNERTSCR